MDLSADQANKRKNTSFSILAGIGYGIGSLILGTVIPASAIYLFFEIGTGMCFETCFFGVYFLSPFIGLCIALIAGIVGGRRTFKRLSEKK
jgi:hypothetical protein